MIDEISEKDHKKIVWNRRYQRLQELIQEDEYFSESSVRIREVFIENIINQSKTQACQYKRGDQRQGNYRQDFSEFLIEQAQKYDYEALLKQKWSELPLGHDYPKLEQIKSINEEQLEENEDELIRLLHDKFMSGLDLNIDYSKIDGNPIYDDMITINRDQEEKYFDDESDAIIIQNQQNSIYTGIQDF